MCNCSYCALCNLIEILPECLEVIYQISRTVHIISGQDTVIRYTVELTNLITTGANISTQTTHTFRPTNTVDQRIDIYLSSGLAVQKFKHNNTILAFTLFAVKCSASIRTSVPDLTRSGR